MVSSLKNGELLQAAEMAGFVVLVTTDMSLKYQQNLSARRIAIVVLSTTSWPRIRAAAAEIVLAVEQSTSGSYTELQIP